MFATVSRPRPKASARRGIPSFVSALGLALVLVASSAGAAAADTELGHNGNVGEHGLTDTETVPGVSCAYGQRGGRLRQIGVWPPTIQPVAGRPNQKLGWRFILQRRAAPGESWQHVYTSSITQGKGDELNVFKSVTPTHPQSDTRKSRYRVIVVMFWYKNGTPDGRARHRVDWYGDVGNAYKGGCKAKLFGV